MSKTTDPNLNVIRVGYDKLGRKTLLNDPDLGQIEYTIDPLGRVIVQVSPNQRAKFAVTKLESEKTRFEYDNLDRMTARHEPDLDSYWTYDTAVNGKGKLAVAYTKTGTVIDYRREHIYDGLGRPGKTTQKLSDADYTSTPSYDAWGRLLKQTHQRGTDAAKNFEFKYQNGYLAHVARGSLVLWKVSAQDASNRPTSILLGNGLTDTSVYYPQTGRLRSTALNADNVSRLQEGYEYDAVGNVKLRSQYWDTSGFQETFKYDVLNRLEIATVQGQPTQTFIYDDAGNLRSKTGVGTGAYDYGAQGAGIVRPHAVKSIAGIGAFTYDDNGNLTSGAGRTITWTSFDMPLNITDSDSSAKFVYGPEHQRLRQERGDKTVVVYAGPQEVEKDASGGITVKTYWPNGIGLEIDRPNATSSVLYWSHVDRLGSVIGLTDRQGVLTEKLAYDAWGKRRTIDGKPLNGTPTPDTLDGKLDNKGFTGHEMLDQLELVHMNGRVYDPLVGRFVSGDPLIQDPIDGQNYNRYSYVLNNPTNNTDPTGFECEKMTGSKVCGVDSGAACSGNCDSGLFKVAAEKKHVPKKDGKVDPKAGGNSGAAGEQSPSSGPGLLTKISNFFSGADRETKCESLGCIHQGTGEATPVKHNTGDPIKDAVMDEYSKTASAVVNAGNQVASWWKTATLLGLGGVAEGAPALAAERAAFTEISIVEKLTRNSANQWNVKLTQAQAIENLAANGFTKALSKDGTVTIMSSGDKVYRFYPASTGGGVSGAQAGVPSASVSIMNKIVTKLRFVGE